MLSHFNNIFCVTNIEYRIIVDTDIVHWVIAKEMHGDGTHFLKVFYVAYIL
jgi:hypothetical protein